VIDGNYPHLGKAERVARADVAVIPVPPRRTCMRASSGA
jgi:hypothetical protein